MPGGVTPHAPRFLRGPGPGSSSSRPRGSRRSQSLGVDVVGDLADLAPAWTDDADDWSDPDAVDPALVADLAVESLALVLDRIGTQRATPSPAEVGTVSKIARRLRP